METTTAFKFIPALLKEFEQEAETAQKLRARIPQKSLAGSLPLIV